MMRRVRSVRPIAAQSGVRSLWTTREIFQPDGRNGATLAIYADERNPRLKHRNLQQAKLAETPDPKGKMPAWLPWGANQDYSTAHPVYRGQLRVANTPSVGTGELHSRLAQRWGAKLPARGREDGGGVVAQRQGVMPWTW